MNPKYFKDQICEELEGASCYLQKAIDTMKSHPEWSGKFKSMSEAEQNHATELYKMFMGLYAESQGKDAYMTSMRDAIMECFSKQMRKIEDYRTTYDMMMYQGESKEVMPSYERSVIKSSIG